MSPEELEQFEAELRQVRPAAPPPALMRGLSSARPGVRQRIVPEKGLTTREVWLLVLRWFAPAAALICAAGFLLVNRQPSLPGVAGSQTVAPGKPLRADEVQVDQELVSTFDAVARLPGGEPVRFHCREWMDLVTVHDHDRGLVIEKRAPRIEVVPVRFETY